MALGDVGNSGNSNGNRVFDQTYYSRIRIKNKDKLALGFSFSRGLLKAEISRETDGYRYEPVTFINITPTKAKMLVANISEFIARMKSGETIDPNYAIGINSGLKDTVKFLAVKVTGNRTDIPEHSLTIGEVTNDGVTQNVTEFIFNTDYDYSLEWTDLNTMDFGKKVDQFMGIQTFVDVLREFADTSAGALGAAVWDSGRYETNRILRKMDPIWDKLGIERKNPNANNYNNDNYFSRNNGGVGNGMNPPTSGGKSTKKTFEDIEDMLS